MLGGISAFHYLNDCRHHQAQIWEVSFDDYHLFYVKCVFCGWLTPMPLTWLPVVVRCEPIELRRKVLITLKGL